MTLDERLKEILDKHDNELARWDKGNGPYPTPSTILAIKQAVFDSLPGEQDDYLCDDPAWDAGWNAYREEVRKVLSPIEIDTGDGFKPVSVDRGSFSDPDSST